MLFLSRHAACGVDSGFRQRWAAGQSKGRTCETLFTEAAGLDAGAFPFRGFDIVMVPMCGDFFFMIFLVHARQVTCNCLQNCLAKLKAFLSNLAQIG